MEIEQLRADIYGKEVLAKCKSFKTCALWPNEQKIRPVAWLDNFDEQDKEIASLLLDCFIYFKNDHTDALLMSAYHSIAHLDIDLKGQSLDQFVSNAVFTIVTGESPNPTDSGNFIIRKVRQLLNVPEANIVTVEVALQHAGKGGTVIFLDDFIGSGDQFIGTWERKYGQNAVSFADVFRQIDFACVYVTLIACEQGIGKINNLAPSVYISPAHVLTVRSSVFGIKMRNITLLNIYRSFVFRDHQINSLFFLISYFKLKINNSVSSFRKMF